MKILENFASKNFLESCNYKTDLSSLMGSDLEQLLKSSFGQSIKIKEDDDSLSIEGVLKT